MNVDVISLLESRRRNVILTLQHIREQQMEADSNTEWRDLGTQRRRSRLLADLLGWYDGRLKRIDRALGQVTSRQRSGLSQRMKPAEKPLLIKDGRAVLL
jgi:hypothetical protein